MLANNIRENICEKFMQKVSDKNSNRRIFFKHGFSLKYFNKMHQNAPKSLRPFIGKTNLWIFQLKVLQLKRYKLIPLWPLFILAFFPFLLYSICCSRVEMLRFQLFNDVFFIIIVWRIKSIDLSSVENKIFDLRKISTSTHSITNIT
jgi:hypothetical protein